MAGIVAAKMRKQKGDKENFKHNVRVSDNFLIHTNRVFIDECNITLAYNFGQKASRDLGYVSKVSFVYDILLLCVES